MPERRSGHDQCNRHPAHKWRIKHSDQLHVTPVNVEGLSAKGEIGKTKHRVPLIGKIRRRRRMASREPRWRRGENRRPGPACAGQACGLTSLPPVRQHPGRPKRAKSSVLTTLAAAFPGFGSRVDRATFGPELGVEPPIRLGDERLDRHERRTASLRWLAGASLAGLFGVDPDRRGALSRSRQSIRLRRGAGVRCSGAARRRAGRGGQSRQGRSAASARRHRFGQADLQGSDDHQGRRQGSGEGAAVHPSSNDADDRRRPALPTRCRRSTP